MRKLLLLLFIVPILLPSVYAVITACGSVAASDTLGADIGSTGTCLTITADDVEIDCNGYGINYSTTTAGNGILATGRDNIVIRNCNIEQNSTVSSSEGIQFDGTTTNSAIINNNITTAGTTSNGVHLFFTDHINVTGNTIYLNSTGDGVQILSNHSIFSYNNVTLRNASTTANVGITIGFTNTINDTITHNVVNILKNGSGVTASTSGGHNITFNTITLHGPTGFGIGIGSEDWQNISNNDIYLMNVTGNGIRLTINAGNNTFRNNNLTAFGANATYVSYLNPTPTDNDNNFTNTTFGNANGSIHFSTLFDLPTTGSFAGVAGVNISTLRLNVSFNSTFLNVTNLTFLNLSANITLNGLTFTDPKPMADYEDDNIFTDCGENCTEVSYVGGTFVFNVTHFTNFSALENGSMGCPLNVSTSTILTGDLNCPATAVNITGNDLVFSCAGYSIYYANGSIGFGINVTNSTNVTIEDCTIVSLNFTSGSNVAINFTNSNNTVVRNTTLKPHGLNSNHGIAYVRGSQNGTIENNTIFANGTSFSNNGIFFVGTLGAQNNFTIRNNTITTNGTITSHGIAAVVATNILIINNSIVANTSGGLSKGVEFTTVNDSRVFNNSIHAGLNPGATSGFNEGVEATLSNRIVVANNTISANGTGFQLGIHMTGTPNNLLENNSVNAFGSLTTTSGVFIVLASNNTIINNIINTNGTNNTNGVNLTASNDNFVINNTIFVNSADDSAIGPSNGIAMNNSARNNISGNIISTILSNGVRFEGGGTTGNLLVNNSIAVFATLSTVYGIKAEGTLFRAPRNSIINNSILTNSTNGIDIASQNDHYLIKNNTINTFNGTAFGFNAGSIAALNNLTFEHNSIFMTGTSINFGFRIDGVMQNSTIANNTIFLNTTGSLNRGIYLFAAVTLNQRNNTFFNNTINVNGTFGSFGILIDTRSVGNNVFNYTNITLTGNVTNIFGIAIAGNNTFDNTFFNDPVSWINQTNGTIQTRSNFTNTTFFVPGNGSIRFNGTFQLNGTENITKEKLDIDFNQSKVNSTNLTFLNTTAQITLNGLPFTDPEPVVDFEDDGTFVDCSSSICTEDSFTGGIFVYNVTHFTNFSSAETVNATCPLYVNETSNLLANLTCPATAIIVNASNLAFTCVNSTITFDTAGGGNDSGILAENVTNITIQNCIILDSNASGAFGLGINFTNVTNSHIGNNTILTNGTTDNYGVYFNATLNTNITNNTIVTNGTTFNDGIHFDTGTALIRSSANVISVRESASHGFFIRSLTTHNNITNNTIRTNGTGSSNVGIDIQPGSFTARIVNNSISTFGVASNIGISVASTSPVTGNHTMIGNTIRTNGTSGSNQGIAFFALPNIVGNNTVAGNTIISNGTMTNFGIDVLGTSNVTLANNTITSLGNESLNAGLKLSSSSNITAINNTILLNSSTLSFGIQLQFVSNSTFNNNSITTLGADQNHGIRFFSPASNNTFFRTVISTTGTLSYGIFIESTNNSFNNTILNTTEWINQTAVGNNYTNTTFATGNGSILIIPRIQVNGTQDIRKSKLNILFNNSFLNSTNLSFFNTSGQITLNALPFTDPKPVVNFTDGSVFIDCDSSICTEISYAGGIFVYNVTHFTNFSSAETVNATCPLYVNETSNLLANLTCPATAIIVNASNLAFTCVNSTITFDTAGGGNDTGILAENVTNITIQNCFIVDGNASGSSGIGINFTNTTNSDIINNTIQTNGTFFNLGIGITNNSVFNSIENNTVQTFGTLFSNHGIFFFNNASSNNITDNTIRANGTGSTNQGIRIHASDNTLVLRNNVANGGTGSSAGITFVTNVIGGQIGFNNISVGNGSGDEGIDLLRNSSNTLVYNNNVITNGTAFQNGIVLEEEANNHIVANNSVVVRGQNRSVGIFLQLNATNNTIINNTVTIANGTQQNHGIAVFGRAENSLIANNTVSTNGSVGFNTGIFTNHTTNISIINNTVATNGLGPNNYGITMSDTNTSNITENSVFSNGAWGSEGINMNDSSTGLLITQNTVFTDSSDNQSTGESANHGITINSGVHTVNQNNVTTDGFGGLNVGILLFVVDDNNVTNNIVHTDGGMANNFGISFTLATGNIVSNNSINSTGNTSHGIFIASSADSNTFNGNNVTTMNTSSYGVQFLSGSSNIFTNTLLNNPTEWIDSTSPSTSNNFTNTTFQTLNGSISTTGLFTMPDTDNVTHDKLDITLNLAFLNSTNLTYLNQSANITLLGIPAGNTVPIFDLNDDGIFEDCFPPRCTNFVNTGTATFDVSEWTSYSTSNGNISITISKTDSVDPIISGGTVVYTLTVNVTNGTAYNITLSDIYPAQASFVNSSPAPDAGNNTWIAGNLSANESFQVNVTVTLTSTVDITVNNTANITYSNFTGSTLTANVTESTTILTSAGITVTKTDTPDPVLAGGILSYTITVTAVGGTASNITVTETYPANVTFNTASPAPSPGNNTFTLGNLTSGSSTTINITVNVSSALTAGTILTNSVNATFQNSTGDTLTANTTTNTTVTTPSPPPPPSGGGSGGAGGAASLCDTICLSPLYENAPQCLRCKPAQQQQPVCVEQWKCDEWSDCSGSEQVRSCQDITACGTYTFRPSTRQACGPQQERPTYQETSESTDESATTYQQSTGTVTRKPAKTLFSLGSISFTTKHLPVIIGAIALYVILLSFIVWHNKHKRRRHK